MKQIAAQIYTGTVKTLLINESYPILCRIVGRNVLNPYSRMSWQNCVTLLNINLGSVRAIRISVQLNSSLPMYARRCSLRTRIIHFSSSFRK